MKGTYQIEFEVVVVFLLDLYDQGFCFRFLFLFLFSVWLGRKWWQRANIKRVWFSKTETVDFCHSIFPCHL